MLSLVFFFFLQEIDGKRDQFRKYIESKGVIDSITKVLIKLLETPEKPEHPMDFIRANLGATQAEERRIESLEQEVSGYKKEVSELKSQLEAVKAKLNEYEKEAETNETDEKKNEEKPTVESSQVVDSKPVESVGGAEADSIKDKTIAESEKAATPNLSTTTVDSAKATNDSENADVAQSNTSTTKSEDENKSESTNDDGDKTKASDNAVIPNENENEK